MADSGVNARGRQAMLPLTPRARLFFAVDALGCLRSLRARSALDGVSWVQRGSVEIAVSRWLATCNRIGAVVCSLPSPALTSCSQGAVKSAQLSWSRPPIGGVAPAFNTRMSGRSSATIRWAAVSFVTSAEIVASRRALDRRAAVSAPQRAHTADALSAVVPRARLRALTLIAHSDRVAFSRDLSFGAAERLRAERASVSAIASRARRGRDMTPGGIHRSAAEAGGRTSSRTPRNPWG
jgi:hypothetical protein